MFSFFNNFYFLVAIKLLIGLLSLSFVINISGKGNLAPSNASDQIQNYVLGGIIGGTIYNSAITVLQYILILLLWCIVILGLKWVKTNNHFMGQLLDGQPLVLVSIGKDDAWLTETLADMGYRDLSRIFLVEYRDGKLLVSAF